MRKDIPLHPVKVGKSWAGVDARSCEQRLRGSLVWGCVCVTRQTQVHSFILSLLARVMVLLRVFIHKKGDRDGISSKARCDRRDRSEQRGCLNCGAAAGNTTAGRSEARARDAPGGQPAAEAGVQRMAQWRMLSFRRSCPQGNAREQGRTGQSGGGGQHRRTFFWEVELGITVKMLQTSVGEKCT